MGKQKRRMIIFANDSRHTSRYLSNKGRNSAALDAGSKPVVFVFEQDLERGEAYFGQKLSTVLSSAGPSNVKCSDAISLSPYIPIPLPGRWLEVQNTKEGYDD